MNPKLIRTLCVGVLFIGLVSANKCPPPETIMPCRCRGRNDQIQVWCSHSDLERVNGALENLMRLRSMPAIDELIVENNKMPSLPARAFGALRIGRLLLRNNGLESLSRNAFAGLEESLEEIYMVEDKLVDFPFDAVEKLRNLEAFTVERSNMRLLPKFNGLNKMKHIRIDGSQISALPVGAFAAMNSIKHIHITGSKVDRLAEGIFGRMDSLVLLNFTGNKIDHVQRRPFALLPRLEVLSLARNRLTDAPMIGRALEDLSGLKSLDLSENDFKELPEGSFVNLRSLQMLNLNSNQISRVHSRSFTHLPALRRVDLNSNLLRTFPKMLFDSTPLLEELRMRKNMLTNAEEIGQVLLSLKSLRYLDVGNNGLTSLPPNSVRDHTHLQILDFSDNKIQRLETNSFKVLPSLEELSLRNNSLQHIEGSAWDIASLKELDLSQNNLQEITGQVLKGLPAIKRLDISRNELKSLANSPFSGAKDLEFLDVSQNQISSVLSEALSNLPNLQKLELSRNHLEMIPNGSFQKLRSLISLNIAHNRINTIPADSFSDLVSLEELSLKGNSLAYLPIGLFQKLAQLRDLNLKHNAISEISARHFQGLGKLEQLRLSSNQIRSFEDTSFDDMPNLRGIDLSSNRISRLNARSFKNLPSLEKFEARENRISLVETGTLQNSENLQILDLAHNALERVPKEVLKANVLLKIVDLSHNQIRGLDKDTFTPLKSLMELYLNDNKIQKFDALTFTNLSSLTILDLDGNELEDLATETFSSLPRLIYLRISRNKMKRIQRSAFSNLTALDGLDMFMNELDDISPAAFNGMGALKYLNLSHNNLDSLQKSGIEPLGSLEVLDMSYNRINSIDADALSRLIWLVELRVNDNGICSIPPGTFDGMNRLKMLVLRNNRIRHLLESVLYKLKNNIAFLDVSGNPLECDCEMTWLRNLIIREELQELSDAICDNPTSLKGVAMRQARPNQMVCSNSPSNSITSRLLQDTCDPLPQSKRKQRPTFIEHAGSEERPIFGGKDADLTGYSDGRHSFANRREPQGIPDNDYHYVTGDTPTIYAGTKTHAPHQQLQEVQKSSSSGNVLSSIFGIPIDFGFNFGISPAFSWANGNKKDGKKEKRKGTSDREKLADPLPPSWINRPNKIKNVYEAPEYLPRRPPQPYIPLNPISFPQDQDPSEPSGSVDVHKAVIPKKGPGIKFPTTGPSSSSTPKTSWHPKYEYNPPEAETGFIPIEPFFHSHNGKKQDGSSRKFTNKKFLETPSDAPITEKEPLQPSAPETETQAGDENGDDDNISSSPSYVPVKVLPSSTSEKSVEGGKKDLSLSDFWGLFTGSGGSSTTEQTKEEEEKDTSYEEDENASSVHDQIDGVPFNFSAPIDQPLSPTEPPDSDDDSDTLNDPDPDNGTYNIPFGRPGRPVMNRKPSITGKPTITKIIEIETENPRNSERKVVMNENEILEDVPKGKVPPVLIGDNSEEPRDWYYTNYHNQPEKENEVVQRLSRLQSTDTNEGNNRALNLNSIGGSAKSVIKNGQFVLVSSLVGLIIMFGNLSL